MNQKQSNNDPIQVQKIFQETDFIDTDKSII